MASRSKLLCQMHELSRGAAFEFGIRAGSWNGNHNGDDFGSQSAAAS